MSEISAKRVPNFAASETELLTTLVKKYANVLENKKTDVVNNQLKDVTWSKLAEDFNSASGIYPRNVKTLRAKYENIKKVLKRKYGEHRRSLYRTGGGPPQDLHLTQEEEVILELAGPSVEGLPARYDSDTIPDQKCENNMTSQDIVIAEVTVSPIKKTDDCSNEMESRLTGPVKVISATPERFTESTQNRFMLKRKRSAPLIQRNPEAFINTMGSYGDLSKKKQDLVDAQIKNVEQKSRHDQIEHELKCAQLQNKLKQDTREHDLRCELLSLDIMIKKKIFNSYFITNIFFITFNNMFYL